MSLESVAIYSVAQYIYSVFSSISTVPISMYMPQIAKDMTGAGLQGKELTESLVQPCRLVVILSGMIMFGFIAVGRQFLTILYGEQYLPAWQYALIIIIPMFVNMTNGILINVLDILKKRMVRSYILLGTTILNILLTIYLIDRIGIIGAVIATAISVIIGQDLIMNVYYSRKIGIRILSLFRSAYKGLIIVEMLSCGVSAYISNQIKDNVVSLFIGGFAFLVLCIVGFFWFGFNDYEKELGNSFLRRLRGRHV